MPNLNSCNLIGHLGHDAEVKTVGDGKTIVNINLAVSTGYGEYKRTAWTRVSVFGKNAEWIAEDGAHKGDLCIISNAEYRVDEVEKDGEMKRYHSFAVGGIGQNCWIIPRNRDDEGETQGELKQKAQKEDNTPDFEENDDLPF